ncbi:hypothetical protein NEF87_004479 [Candidatus Lokiarchaeum ossiferum]|uniref:Roadblock/LAMTOR2 domain-containing protein n=1 Tax=Candidatus Lokiarchaeum ossiferum TaxID=2951803 RepID=A0ABY6I0G4_9ARCH|nr:hypothetical protein NEF87_004479 [Candidatus Lokiarchaeum sp. B-35]
MSMVEPETAKALMNEIQRIESGTDLKRVAVISRIGMKIATATSDEMDADAETASSSALIDLAERLCTSVDNGSLREILVKSDSGFVILQFVNNEYMLFGGIENPLRVGFYMEYLRNAAHKFAFILAGNQVTDALKKEIEANRDRDQRIQQEAKANLSENFEMDKSTNQDMAAMEGVLDFLKDWSDEDVAVSPNENNIVGIDQDMMFDMDDLAPTPITKDQISQAQTVNDNNMLENQFSESEDDILGDIAKMASDMQPPKPDSAKLGYTEEENLDDILAALDGISESSLSSDPTSTIQPESSEIATEEKSIKPVEESNEGLPDDILAALDDIADMVATPSTSAKSKEKKKDLPYGIVIYEGEVPPVALEDYVSFEIGSLAPKTEEFDSEANEIYVTEQKIIQKSEPATFDAFTTELKIKDDGSPDFNEISSEYDDSDLNIEEDAMLQALAELDLSSEEKKKKMI